MKKKVITSIVFALASSSAFAATGFFGSYINVTSSNQNAGAATWYDLQAPGGFRASDPADFSSFSFGTFDPTAGGIFNLTGVEGLTYKDTGAGDDVTAVNFNYRIIKSGDPAGSFITQSVGWTADATFADAAGTSYSGSGDQKWADTAAWQPLNLLTGLTSGDYTLEVYLQGAGNRGDFYSNNGGPNYIANFTVVPETSTSLLGAVAALALLRRKR